MRLIDNTENRELIRVLSLAPLFSSLGHQELDFIAGYCAIYEFDADEHIYCVGSVRAELFVIVHGSVGIYRTTDEQDEEAVARFVQGESFGELGLLSEEPREELARTENVSRVLIFPRRNMQFTEILASRPEIASRLLRKLMEAAASRLRHANRLIKQNSPWIRELQRQVYTDPLTGLPNRTFLEENLGSFFSSGQCSLLMFKPDNFKQINDSFGHKAGDAGIRQIGRLLTRTVLPEEQIARFMGNEYALICPGTDIKEAMERAREVQELLCSLNYTYEGKPNNIVVTASAGIAVYPAHAVSPGRLIEKAHSLALRGRTLGGRQLLIASPEADTTQ
ncbi:GGDEF domain-containing protein [Marispirochaeta sp.]|uniref:GGDEF domain-containing protein n=1 Tax=Marispirochaeta sp. TaxID=2038653 RepID=UPI0029C8D121|nr:GGDEF domain-containing protein [Marispirochaeta sp.]